MIFPALRSQSLSTAKIFPEYLEICHRISAQFAQEGLLVPAAGPQAKHRFCSHPNPQRVVKILRAYCEVLQSQLDAGESLRDDKKLLWRMLAKLGYTPRSSVFDAIEAGDVIEVFTGDNWQIFRNMAYFERVHITVDELATLRWSRDYKRTLMFLLACLKLVLRFKSGFIQETEVVVMDRHEVQILGGGIWQKFSTQLKMISPLKVGSKIDAFVVTSDPHLIP